MPPDASERRYALREVNERLHQALRAGRLWGTVRDLPSAARAARTAGDLEWPTVNEDPPCRFRCSPDRRWPRFPSQVSERLLDLICAHWAISV